MRFLISFTVFFIHCSIGFCQLDKVTAPFITSFNITELGVRNVEQLKQAENGLYYMATSAGLLETDGVNHFLYRKGKLTNLSSIYVASDKLIYSAGIGGFGLWEKNEYGRFEYTSLHYVAPTKEDYLQPHLTISYYTKTKWCLNPKIRCSFSTQKMEASRLSKHLNTTRIYLRLHHIYSLAISKVVFSLFKGMT
jgi:hypothetical protein